MRGGIVERRAGGLIWFAGTSLEKAGFRHGFTARPGGASRGAFASLNFTSRQGDRADRVLENWRRLETAAGLPEKWGLVRQVHGATVSRRLRGRRATESREGCAAADAVMTGSGRIALGILTADCLPLILAVEGTDFFTVVHAGWQGTLRGIAAGAARQLAAAAGVGTEDVTALIGPSIGRCCYQVGHEVFGAFDREWGGGLRRAFRRTDPWHFDLKTANRMQLRETGLKARRIGVVDLCTCCCRDLFFSHRRDGFRTGRMLAFATAAPPPLPGPPRRG